MLGTTQGTIIYCDGGGGSTTTRVSPNPTNGQTNISFVSEFQNLSINQIIVKNKMGRLFINQKVGKLKKYNLNLSTLPNDVYLIEIFDGKVWNSHKVILQK